MITEDLFNELMQSLRAKPKSDKIEGFKYIQEFLGNINTINSGGCGIAAYSMYLWLRQNNKLPEDFEIIYLFRGLFDEDEFNNNKNFLEGNSDVADSCLHAVVKMNGQYLDSKGTYNPESYVQLGIGRENVDRFMVSSLNQPKWNRSFNREKYIPAIEKELGVDLSSINKVLNY